jgi:hypothetical protein
VELTHCVPEWGHERGTLTQTWQLPWSMTSIDAHARSRTYRLAAVRYSPTMCMTSYPADRHIRTDPTDDPATEPSSTNAPHHSSFRPTTLEQHAHSRTRGSCLQSCHRTGVEDSSIAEAAAAITSCPPPGSTGIIERSRQRGLPVPCAARSATWTKLRTRPARRSPNPSMGSNDSQVVAPPRARPQPPTATHTGVPPTPPGHHFDLVNWCQTVAELCYYKGLRVRRPPCRALPTQLHLGHGDVEPNG